MLQINFNRTYLFKQSSINNKLFQYLQAGLAVIATETAGQLEILFQWSAAERLIPSNNPLALAQVLEDLLRTPRKLTTAKAAALQAAKKLFFWEQPAEIFLQTAQLALVRK